MYGAGGAAKYEAGEYLDVCEMIPSAFENAAGASSQHLIKMGALSTSYRFDGNPAAVGVVGNQARILSSTGRSASPSMTQPAGSLRPTSPSVLRVRHLI
jgi:hypothetical protein